MCALLKSRRAGLINSTRAARARKREKAKSNSLNTLLRSIRPRFFCLFSLSVFHFFFFISTTEDKLSAITLSSTSWPRHRPDWPRVAYFARTLQRTQCSSSTLMRVKWALIESQERECADHHGKQVVGDGKIVTDFKSQMQHKKRQRDRHRKN